MGNKRHDTGQLGEAFASSYLERKGYRILARNYRCRLGEVDVIASSPDVLLFVEVRTKHRPSLVTPEETIGRAKAERMVRSAEHYLMETGQENVVWRLDLVAVELGEGGKPVRIEHHQDAVSDILG